MTDSAPIRGRFSDDPRVRAAFAEGAGIYRIVPRAVARPADADDCAALVRWAARTGTPLVPRGAGSAMGGGNVGDGVIVDLGGLAAPLEIDAVARRARTGAGVTWAALDAAAAPHGLRLPPDPSSGRFATLGGVVATNAAGARTVRHGPVRPWVESLDVVTADGERTTLARGAPPDGAVAAVARFLARAAPLLARHDNEIRARFPRTTKNTAGYALDHWLDTRDLLDLVVGSEGTLALVTAIEWRLDPRPAASATLRVRLATLEALGGAVAALRAHHPSAIELLDRTFLELVAQHRPHALGGVEPGEALLLVAFEADDAPAAATWRDAAARDVAPHAAAVDRATTDAQAASFWALRHAASPILASFPPTLRSMQVIEDGCVPVPRLDAYVAAVRAAARRHGVTAVLFGHAGDGHLHVNLLPDVTRPDWRGRVGLILAEVTEAVVALGGTPAGEHGVGRLRAPLLEQLYGPAIVRLMREVKHALDPAGILNPGIVTGGDDPPLARLKVGDDAAPLPPDLADALRALEREGAWERDRWALAGGA